MVRPINHREAEATLALLRHLDGSDVQDAETLMDDVRVLHTAAAAVPRGGALPLDEEVILDVLDTIGAWADNDMFYGEPERPVENTPISGDVL